MAFAYIQSKDSPGRINLQGFLLWLVLTIFIFVDRSLKGL